MTKEQFIERVGNYTVKHYNEHKILPSMTIAQAILESAYGKSELAVNAHNYFGMKWTKGCGCDYYEKKTGEQRKDGSYYVITAKFRSYKTMNKGLKGYYDFIESKPWYNNLKGVTDYKESCKLIKEDGWATSLKYTENLIKIIEAYKLYRYDYKVIGKEGTVMGNSKLVSYTRISPNKSTPRNHKIDTISIHCMAGNLTIKNCGQLFASSTVQASSNYGVDSDGQIGMYVEEKDRSWCTSSKDNDNRAITIEVANNGGADKGWPVSQKAYDSLIALLVDICKRNKIKELKWKADKSLIGQVSKQNMTVHRWFAAKACPGDYLFKKHYQIAEDVNNRLTGKTKNHTLYQVLKDVPLRTFAGKKFKQIGTLKKGLYTVSKIEKTSSTNVWGYVEGKGWFCIKTATKKNAKLVK